MLHISNASKKFGDHTILDQLNLTINSPSIIGLSGPSGSGKSTLLRCIQGLDTLDSGIIKLEGKSGFMFQDFQLFPHMNVLKNLTYAPSLQHNIDFLVDKALQLLQTLSLGTKTNAYPHQLSGGQKQRVALARILMMQPKILLCDEPTSGLDAVSIGEVVSLLKEIKSLQVAMVIASHNLEFLREISDQLLLLKNGKLV
jgi:polar amino acid transport system ATP-binding protein